MRKVVIGAVIVIVAVIVIGGVLAVRHFSTPDHQQLAADQKILAGRWVDQAGDSLVIREDGGGDYKSPGFSVNGGAVFITGDQLTIQFSVIKKQFAITKRPTAQDPTLALDQVVYRRTNPDGTVVVAPLTPEQGADLNAAMAAALYKAIEADDAGILSAQFSAAAQREVTGPVLRQSFAGFFKKAMLPALDPALKNWPKTATITSIDGTNYAAENKVALSNKQVFTISTKYIQDGGAYKASG